MKSIGTRLMAVLVAAAAVGVFGFQGPALASDAHTDKEAVVKLESIWQSYCASIRHEAMKTGHELDEAQLQGSASAWLTRVSPEEVNMVTNRVAHGTTESISLNGKSYFISDEGYARTLKTNTTLRFSTDPLTGARVDKATAATFADASGRVFYFESEKTCKDFLSLADEGTVYGYSSPE